MIYHIQVRMEADGTVSEVKVAHTGDPEVIEVSMYKLTR